MTGTVTIKDVKLPIFAIVKAIPRAIRAAKAEAADNKDPDSPGGRKVTPGEVTEVVLAFVLALAEVSMPTILEANGLPKTTADLLTP